MAHTSQRYTAEDQPRMRLTAIAVGIMLAVVWLLPIRSAAQCSAAPKGSITIFMFDLKSPDIPRERLNKLLDILTFRLNTAIREDLSSRGLLGGSLFTIRWCSGTDVNGPDAAVAAGKKLNSSGVFWGFIDQSSGQMKSTLRLTALVDNPITDLRNILYKSEMREGVDNSYISFAAYIVGKTHLQRGNLALARKCFKYARDLRSLPELMMRDCTLALTQIDEDNPAKKLTPVGR